MIRTGLEGEKPKKDKDKRDRLRYLPDNIYDAIQVCKTSKFMTKILGEESKDKFIHYKQVAADRSPKALGTAIKRSEIIYHHEVTNQLIWNNF